MVVPTSRIVAAVALVLSLAVAGAAYQPAQPEPKQPESAQPSKPDEKREARRAERMNVGDAMGLMGRSLGKLQEQIADAAKRDENLRLINEVQRGVVAAKGQPLPPGVLQHAADAAAKTKASETYRKDLIAVMRTLLDLETAIAEEKPDAAKAHFDEVMKMADAAHGRLPAPKE